MSKGESKTLLEILEKHAAESSGKIAFTFHHDPPCTFSDLWQRITWCGGYLIQQGLKPGEPVIIAIPNSGQFFYAFYGVQRAGGIAVPVFPGSGGERILKLADLCGDVLIITSKTYPPDNIDELKQKAKVSNRRLLSVDEIIKSFYGGSAQSAKRHAPCGFPLVAGDTAFVQFTSGSIGDSKGVQLTHANLITNVEQMIAGMEITSKDIFVSWLPVYHDMGLILMTMVPFYLGLSLKF